MWQTCRMFRSVRLVLCSFLLVFTSGFAQEPAQPSLKDHAKKDFEATDAKLRQIYDKLLTGLNVEQRKEFETVHNQWIEFREAAAKFTAALSTKSEDHLEYFQHIEKRKLTEERIFAFQRILAAQSAD